MKFKEGRSLLQETVVRNLPYCDEFIIVTNEAYKNIVNGQMKAFQSLKYRVILEGTAKGTAAAIMLGTMFANPTEFVLVVNSDNFIDGDGYKDAIIGAKEIAKKGVIAAVGVKPEYQAKNLGYIKRDGNDVIKILSNVDLMMQHLRLQTAIHMRRGIYGIVEYLCSGQVIWLISQERNVLNCIQPAVQLREKFQL